MVKMENAITVKAIVIRNYRYIKFCEHVKKIEMKFFMLAGLGSDSFRLRLQENTAPLDSNILRLSLCGFGCGSQVLQVHSFPGPFDHSLSCRGPFVHLLAEQYLVHLQRRNSVCISLFFSYRWHLLHYIFHSRPSTFALKIIILRTKWTMYYYGRCQGNEFSAKSRGFMCNYCMQLFYRPSTVRCFK